MVNMAEEAQDGAVSGFWPQDAPTDAVCGQRTVTNVAGASVLRGLQTQTANQLSSPDSSWSRERVASRPPDAVCGQRIVPLSSHLFRGSLPRGQSPKPLAAKG